jgi:hypothetical protein
VIVTVTWMDGTRETFHCDEWTTEDGVLWMRTPDWTRFAPLANVKIVETAP